MKRPARVCSPLRRRRGVSCRAGQAVVQFAEDVDARAAVAIKFFARDADFAAEAAMYMRVLQQQGRDAQAALVRFVPRVGAVRASRTTAGRVDGVPRHALPPCVALERGESLQDWAARTELRGDARTAQCCMVRHRAGSCGHTRPLFPALMSSIPGSPKRPLGTGLFRASTAAGNACQLMSGLAFCHAMARTCVARVAVLCGSGCRVGFQERKNIRSICVEG